MLAIQVVWFSTQYYDIFKIEINEIMKHNVICNGNVFKYKNILIQDTSVHNINGLGAN